MQTIDHQELARCLFDESNDTFFIFRPEDGVVVDANPAAMRMTGLTHARLVEMRLDDLFRPDGEGNVADLLDAIQGTGHFPASDDFLIFRKTGASLPVRVSASRIHTRPEPLGLAVVFDNRHIKQTQEESKQRSITLQERVEERTAELQKSETRFRSLIENSFDVITMFDQTGKLLYISPSIQRVLGYEPSELVGQQGPQIVHPDDIEEAGRFFARGLEHPGQPMHMTHRLLHKNGSYRTVEVTGINLLDVPGVEAMVSNFRDVTERHQAEQALAETERRLHELAENVDDVFWVVAADFSELFYVTALSDFGSELCGQRHYTFGQIDNFRWQLPDRTDAR